MIADKSVLCIIPVRGGSKGVVGKNMRELAGRPLAAYTFEQASGCSEIDRTIVSTDSQELAELARLSGVDVPFMRPEELAQDHVGTIDVLLHAMSFVEREEGRAYDLVVLLHATAPLRAMQDIRDCLSLVAPGGAQNAFSVAKAQRNPYFNMVETGNDGSVHLCKQGSFATRQDAPDVYELNSAVYVWPWEELEREKAVILGGSRVHVMPRERSIDIDDEIDFGIAEYLMRGATPAKD